MPAANDTPAQIDAHNRTELYADAMNHLEVAAQAVQRAQIALEDVQIYGDDTRSIIDALSGAVVVIGKAYDEAAAS